MPVHLPPSRKGDEVTAGSNSSRRKRPPPQIWSWNDADLDSYSERFWRLPRRLVADGMLADLWQGCSTASSVLSVLAVHTWPGKTDLPSARGESHRQWTGWSYLSRRRMAILAGCDKDTAGRACRLLVELGLMQLDGTVAGRRNHFRLLKSLYPNDEEDYATIPAMLIYGGTWHMLPTAAARHLYLVLAALDPIGDEESYLEKLASDGLNWMGDPEQEWEGFDSTSIRELQRQRFLSDSRRLHTASVADLTRGTGMTRNTVKDALRQLTVPIFGDVAHRDEPGKKKRPISLVAEGNGWRVPDRGAWDYIWKSEFMRNRENILQEQRRCWPWLSDRRQRPPGGAEVAHPGQSGAKGLDGLERT